MDWLREFFSSKFFMPHGHCYLWKPELVWLQVVSNALIGLSYVAIASTLAYLVYRVRDIPFKLMYLAFGIFIITCGFTHFMDVWVIWEPHYWLDGGIRALTAAASLATAVFLPRLVPEAVALARGAKAAHDRGMKLEAAVKDLATVNERMKELDELKTQFFANVSHELRTPLALILGPAEQLSNAQNLSDAQRWDLEVVIRNARTLLKHVNDLLDLSKLDAGRLEPRYARIDAAELTRVTAAGFDALAKERRIELSVDTPKELSVEVDPDQVQRILLNLLSNAFKFTPAGGRVRCSVRVLQPSAAGQPARWCFAVGDSGPGVRPQQRQLIFERFRQGDVGSTRQFGGTGLGLSIARDFAELHGGSISVADAPEGGALFTVTLPLTAPQGTAIGPAEVIAPQALEPHSALAQASEGPPASTPLDSESPLVLVVEDNADMRAFVRQTLSSDYRVEEAADGEEGLLKATELEPDLIVSDIMMPRMSGDQLVEAVRTRSELDAVPVLMLTAKADDALRIRVLERGAQDYVVKPFSARELKARAQNLIAMKRARNVLQKELGVQVQGIEQLARELAARKRELETTLDAMRVARDQANHASHAKSTFLSIMSHELRTPLTVVLLNVQRLRREPPPQLEPEQRAKSLEKIATSSQRLLALVDSLLEYVRVDSGRLTVSVQPFDLCALVCEVLDEKRPAAEDKGLALRCEAPPEGVNVTSDHRLVRLIVANLIDNSVKYTDQGSVIVRLGVTGAQVCIAVRDTGRGIAPQHLARVFEPFEQLEPARHKHTPGVGLGLALVREMVRSLGGDISVDSDVGQGSTFSVTLPRVAPSSERSGAQATSGTAVK